MHKRPKLMIENGDILNTLKRDKEIGMKMLFDSYYRPLVLFANELLKDVGVAEDVVQELFVKLWQGNYLLKVSSGGLSSYLYNAVRNTCMTKIVKRDILNESGDINGFDIPLEEVSSITEEVVIKVSQAFSSLPDQTRNVVEAVIVKELKYKEAADELHISINTVKTLLKRGVKKLREHMQ
ncbi:MAG: sigma-70 family RNA polymerase sigma factor [Bacteroidales bacterium]